MTEEKKPKRTLFGRKPVAEPAEDVTEAVGKAVAAEGSRRQVLEECVAFLRERGQEDAARIIERKLLGVSHE